LREEAERRKSSPIFVHISRCVPGSLHRYTITMRYRRTRAKFRRRERFYSEIRRSALRTGTGFFVRSALFCRHSDFGRAFGRHTRPRIRSVSAMSNAAVIADQPARQSSRTRYAVGLRCVRADRPPALNADYSGSNGSGCSAATVSAYHQVWASMGTIGSKSWFSMTAARHNTDVQRILLDIAWTLERVSDSHSSEYLLPLFAANDLCEIILYIHELLQI